MGKKVALIFVLVICCLADRVGAQSAFPRKQFAVFLEPFSLGDFVNSPSLRAGAELPIGRYFALSGTAGIYRRGGVSFKGTFKGYISQVAQTKRYLALEYGYLHHSNTVHDNLKQYDTIRGYDVAGTPVHYQVHKEINYLNLKYGVEHSGEHFYFEFYAGAGVRFRNTDCSIPVHEQDMLYHFHESAIDRFTNERGHSILPNIAVGIRIGYHFRKPV